MYRLNYNQGIIILFILFLVNIVTLSASSDIEGYVNDSQTNTSLPGANVLLLGTNYGTATDIQGHFIIKNIPPGEYTIRATYIGYESNEVEIQVVDNKKLEQNFNLNPASLEGETVIVTGQVTGQLEAINKQLSSLQIVNKPSCQLRLE